MFNFLEIATICFSLYYKLAIFTICKFNYIQASKNFESKCKIAFLCNFCFHLELCKLASLPLFMMSTLEILAPPLSLSKRREDPFFNFHIMAKVSINFICASLYIQIKTYTISKALFFMHDTEK